jgi:hypothetical protein
LPTQCRASPGRSTVHHRAPPVAYSRLLRGFTRLASHGSATIRFQPLGRRIDRGISDIRSWGDEGTPGMVRDKLDARAGEVRSYLK